MDIGPSDPSQAGYAQAYCRWLVTAPVGATLAFTPDVSEATGTGEVHLTSLLCPVNYVTGDMTRPALTVACSTPGTDIDYTVTSDGGDQRTGSTGSNDLVEWPNIRPGEVAIEESVPLGFCWGAVYCGVAPPPAELNTVP
jgi:hypothetical protein